MHGLQHWTHFYTPYGQDLQRRFFGHFLKDATTGWDEQPPVLLQVRHVDGTFVERAEREWPLARTSWTPFFLDAEDLRLTDSGPPSPGRVSYSGSGAGVTFLTRPFEADTEITGPLAARLVVSSETDDADLFLVVRVFAPDLAEVTFPGNIDPHTPVAQGWLRASHRKLDPDRSLPYRPYHTHDPASHSGLTSRSISTSRSGRPVSSSRPAIVSGYPSGAPTTSIPASPSDSRTSSAR